MTDKNLDAAALQWFAQHYASTTASSTKRPLQDCLSGQPSKRRRVGPHVSPALATKSKQLPSPDITSLSNFFDERPIVKPTSHSVAKRDWPVAHHVQKPAATYLSRHEPPSKPKDYTKGGHGGTMQWAEFLYDSQIPVNTDAETKRQTSSILDQQLSTDKQPTSAAPRLCSEQSRLVELIMSGRNVFFTGSAGTGKSTVLKEFVKQLRSIGKDVQIVAPTGRAALDINGSTTWTYAGWTPDSMKKPLHMLLKAAHGKFVHRRLNRTDVLVIDEISMVENFHFERLNRLMKEARGNDRAFGGVQLVVTGDFCQLPPVRPFSSCLICGKTLAPMASGTIFKCPEHGQFYEIDKWAFRSQAWKECHFSHVPLTKIHRQSDEIFIRILQKCRIGVPLSDKDKALLLNHKSNTENAVKLFSTREEVGRINQTEFYKLTTPKVTFLCYDFFKWNQEKHRHLESKGRKLFDGSLEGLRDHRYEPKLDLKEGMLVVLLANLDINSGLVNGSQGVIIGFKSHEKTDLPTSKSSDSRLKADLGMSQHGEYAGLKDAGVKSFVQQAVVKKWPIVRFTNGIERAIVADCTVNELGDEKEYSLLSRTQIPLSAAWAMSIHKAQGMTLDKVVVDLAKSFEEGQMYVALSRARNLEGLKVEGLGNWQGRGNDQVKEFLSQKFGI